GPDGTLVGKEFLVNLVARRAVPLRRIGLVIGPLLLLAPRLRRHGSHTGCRNRQRDKGRNDLFHDLSDAVCAGTRSLAYVGTSPRRRKLNRRACAAPAAWR